MSKFDLRDISERLTSSRNTEAVLFEFLGYLQAVRPEWEATLAFYEVSRDALVNVYQRSGTRLQRKDLLLQVDALPPRLDARFRAILSQSSAARCVDKIGEGIPCGIGHEQNRRDQPGMLSRRQGSRDPGSGEGRRTK